MAKNAVFDTFCQKIEACICCIAWWLFTDQDPQKYRPGKRTYRLNFNI